MLQLADRAKALRLQMNLSQEGLAKRSGLSLGSLKRFEQNGEISLKSLLSVALVLNALDDFQKVFQSPNENPQSLDELIQKKSYRQRGKLQ